MTEIIKITAWLVTAVALILIVRELGTVVARLMTL